eukprot:138530_1
MNQMTQDVVKDKIEKQKFLKEHNVGNDLVWQELGWYQTADMVNMKIAIYARDSTDPLHLFKKAFEEGVYLDDMSHVVHKYHRQNLCHSIGFVRHPAKRLPLTVFELISCDWGGTTFKQQFNNWWIFANERYKLDIPSFNVDWDRKLQNRVCEVVNGFDMRTYLEICYRIPQGKALPRQIKHKIFGCHGMDQVLLRAIVTVNLCLSHWHSIIGGT